MERKQVKELLQKVKSESRKRNFIQTVDLIINLKNLDLKKSDDQQDYFLQLKHTLGRKIKVCALIGPELKDAAEGEVDTVIMVSEFDKYAKDPKLAKKLASEHDYFIGQANIMPKIATAFGRVLGSRGKMPNPKVGCVVPPNANLAPLYEKLQTTIRIFAKKSPVIHLAIGKEDMDEKELVDNFMTIYDSIMHHLPNSNNNIKSIILKLTMGAPVRVK
ncbi:MAG: 50S ribosomal protein L1 [Candidatus Woesearchaeota archaeon]|nr:50S ribosomal protein L1 [Candidatus Woesearchaeota archaeon]